jgi:hypothetical protein
VQVASIQKLGGSQVIADHWVSACFSHVSAMPGIKPRDQPPATSGLPLLRSTSKGSAVPVAPGNAASTAAFQMTNLAVQLG